jgi:peptidoglycan/LPS O-acetylase OafA/YrhL
MDYAPGRPWTMGRLPALDGLRGLAILLVLLCHLDVPLMAGAGAAGVTIFFVLSGFLITSLLVRGWHGDGRGHLGRFYLRRVRRLFPALVGLLAVVTCVDIVTGDVAHIGGRVVPALFYVYNWICVNTSVAGDPIGQTWSLSIEEQFYLLWPLVLLICLRLGGADLALRVAAIGAAAALLDRLVLVVIHAPTARIFFASDTNALPLMVGCALALALSQGRLPRLAPITMPYAGIAVFGVCALAAYGAGVDFTLVGPVLVTAAAAAFIARVVTAGAGAGGAFNWRWARALGRVSYSLYLWQTPVIVWGALWLSGLPLAVRAPLLGGVSLACALVSYSCVEAPLRRLGTVSRPVAAIGQPVVG